MTKPLHYHLVIQAHATDMVIETSSYASIFGYSPSLGLAIPILGGKICLPEDKSGKPRLLISTVQ